MSQFIIIYFLLFICFVTQKLFYIGGHTKVANFIIIPSAFIANVVVGMRPLNAGFDTPTYLLFYDSLKKTSLYDAIFGNDLFGYNFMYDYLYKLWNWILVNLGINQRMFLYITGFVSILLFIISLKIFFKKDHLLIFLLFFATPGFVMLFGNAIRQGLSISFFMFSIYYLLQKKNIYYAILFLIITTFFHTSTGFVLLLVILIMNSFYLIQRKNPFILLIIIILIRIASYFLAPLFESFGNTYLMKGTGFSYLLHYSFVFFIILYIFYERCKFKDEISAKLFAVFTSLIALSSFVWYNDVTYGRIIYLYYPFLIYFIVYLNKYFEKNIIKIFFIIIFILLGCYFYSSESMVSTLNSEYFNEY